jgi:hypothetical protein
VWGAFLTSLAPQVEPKNMEIEKTDAEISEEFLEEFKKLVVKYKRDFMNPPPVIIKVDFTQPTQPNDIH